MRVSTQRRTAGAGHTSATRLELAFDVSARLSPPPAATPVLVVALPAPLPLLLSCGSMIVFAFWELQRRQCQRDRRNCNGVEYGGFVDTCLHTKTSKCSKTCL